MSARVIARYVVLQIPGAFLAAGERREGTGTRHLETSGLDGALAEAALHPRVLAATFHVLARPFRLHTASARDPRPGFGLQGLHRDWLPRTPHEPYAVVTTLLLLDEFTSQNGSTRVVPGSHVEPGPVPKALAAPAARHPREERVLAPAGAALVFNGHLLHAGARNDSSGTRRVLQLQLIARDRVRPSAERGSAAELPTRLRFLAG